MYLTDMYVYVLVGICVSKMYYCSHMLEVKNFQKLSSTTTDKLTFYVSCDFILVWWGRESDKMYDNRILERSPPPSYSYPPEMVNNYCTLSYVVIFCKTIFFCAKLVEDDKKIQMPDALVCYNKWVPMSVWYTRILLFVYAAYKLKTTPTYAISGWQFSTNCVSCCW